MSNNLTYFERQKLEYYLRTKQSLRAIAKIMRRNVSIISREVRRNGETRKTYRADIAQKRSEERKHQKRKGKLEKHPKLAEYVEEKIRLDWSPEQIAGRLKACPPAELENITISHESIYYWIYVKSKKYKKLHLHLRTHRPKRKKCGRRKQGKSTIPSRVSIHKRPEVVNLRERIGDWETDTVEFQRKKKNPYLSVQYERTSQLVRIHKVKNKSAEATKCAIIKTGETLPYCIFKTVTFDNGSEGAKHAELKEYFPDLETYFCDPFSSWQKGGVENMNKLIRQYLPRSINMHLVSDEHTHNIQERINNRPRKQLNYLTPNEFIHKSVARLT